MMDQLLDMMVPVVLAEDMTGEGSGHWKGSEGLCWHESMSSGFHERACAGGAIGRLLPLLPQEATK